MHPPLTDVEVRILGSLLEKEVTTPEYYPLSLNALLAACNQTTNRDPVMRLDENTATHHIIALRRGGLLRQIQPVGSRVAKFAHLLEEVLKLGQRELALLGVLMLRGPQTTGELRTRTQRLHEFADVADVESALAGLASREPEPLVVMLPRRPGQREERWAHTLAGEAAARAAGEAGPAEERAPVAAAGDRVARLEAEMAALRQELAELRGELATFRRQFE